jgi:predicted GIY-YIG superfamily endonuclease
LLRVFGMEQPHIVYILQSEAQPTQFYTGITTDVTMRLAAHNAGRCSSTASRRPWRMAVHITFADPERAKWFERYLKSGSGAAFARRHLR